MHLPLGVTFDPVSGIVVLTPFVLAVLLIDLFFSLSEYTSYQRRTNYSLVLVNELSPKIRPYGRDVFHDSNSQKTKSMTFAQHRMYVNLWR